MAGDLVEPLRAVEAPDAAARGEAVTSSTGNGARHVAPTPPTSSAFGEEQ